MTPEAAQLGSAVERELVGDGSELRSAHGHGDARERRPWAGFIEPSLGVTAFTKPSFRRNRFSQNLHFGGISGISPLFNHIVLPQGESFTPDLRTIPRGEACAA